MNPESKPKMRKLKTITLEGAGGPVLVLCPGHVTQKAFNDAFGNEWSERGRYKQADLTFEYWQKLPARTKDVEFRMRRSLPGKPGARPYTVARWD